MAVLACSAESSPGVQGVKDWMRWVQQADAYPVSHQSCADESRLMISLLSSAQTFAKCGRHSEYMIQLTMQAPSQSNLLLRQQTTKVNTRRLILMLLAWAGIYCHQASSGGCMSQKSQGEMSCRPCTLTSQKWSTSKREHDSFRVLAIEVVTPSAICHVRPVF